MPVTAGVALGLAALCGCEDNAEPDDTGQVPNVAPLGIYPAQVALKSTDTVARFAAYGGTPPYFWSISDPTLGGISNGCVSGNCSPGQGAAAITYRRATGAEGINVLTLYDSQGWHTSAYIYQ